MIKLKLVSVIVLSLAIGTITFFHSNYDSSTLVIQATTHEAGQRYIYVEDGASGKKSRLAFEIGSAEGEASVYAIELPRIRLKSILIPPLAGTGKYQVDRITLANDSVSYQWDDNLVCMQRYLRAGLAIKEACGNNSPLLFLDKDFSINISSIPEHGFVNPISYRVAITLFLAFVVLVCGFYLLHPVAEKFRLEGFRNYMVRVAWLGVVLLYGFQLHLLWKYSIDIPYFEEWEFFDASALPGGLSWQWLNQQVSHQRMMVFTKLMAWLNYKLFSLDFVKLKIMNYAVFGCLLVAVVRLKKMVLSDGFPFFPLFMVFLLSPITYEVHAASFQAGETFAVLCSVLMLKLVISNEPSYKKSVGFSLCAVASMCSHTAGMVYALVFLLCDTLYTSANLYMKRIENAAALRDLLLRWLIVLPAILLWSLGFKKPDATIWAVPSLLLPNEGKFWEMFLNLLSFGFGFDFESPLPGIICLVMILGPICLLLKEKETRWEPATWQVLSALAGSLAVLALITVGRGNMGFSIKVPRYAIFGILLVPYVSMAWWLAVRSRWRLGMLTILWSFVAVAFFNNWDYGVYRDIRQLEVLNLECVERYSNGSGDGICPESSALPIGNYFDNARKLGVHFTRQFASANGER
jgi:hypothetical protein